MNFFKVWSSVLFFLNSVAGGGVWIGKGPPQKLLEGRKQDMDAGGRMCKLYLGAAGWGWGFKGDRWNLIWCLVWDPQDQMIPDLTDPFPVSSPVNNFRRKEQRSWVMYMLAISLFHVPTETTSSDLQTLSSESLPGSQVMGPIHRKIWLRRTYQPYLLLPR